MAIVCKFYDYQKHIFRRIISMKTSMIAIYINMDNYDYKENILSEPILLLF